MITPLPERCVICGAVVTAHPAVVALSELENFDLSHLEGEGDKAAVCDTCLDVFSLVDEQTPDMSQPETRVAIGPTDV